MKPIQFGGGIVKIYAVKGRNYEVRCRVTDPAGTASWKRYTKDLTTLDRAKEFAQKKLQDLDENGTSSDVLLSQTELRAAAEAIYRCDKAGIDFRKFFTQAWDAQQLIGPDHNLLDAANAFRNSCPPTQEVSLEQASEEFFRSKSENTSLSSSYKVSLEKEIRTLTERLGNFTLGELQPTLIQNYLNTLPISARSKENRRKTLLAIQKWARDIAGYLPVGNGLSAAKVPPFKSKTSRVHIYSPPEALRILQILPAKHKPAAAIMLFCPVRLSEIQKMSWDHVDVEKGQIYVDPNSKTGWRVILIPDNLKKWLESLENRTGPLSPAASEKAFQTSIKHYFGKAGLTYLSNGFRHSCISYLCAEKNADIQDIARRAGTSREMMQKNYVKLATTEDARAWFHIRIPN